MSKKERDDDLKEMTDKLATGEMLSHHLLPPNATASDKVKYQICQKICRVRVSRKMEYQQMAEIMGCDVVRVKQMTHSHFEAFSMEDLVNYYVDILSALKDGDS